MRISFLGKGGSGKTTLAAAFTLYVSKTTPVLAIDADVNVHLKSTLGFNDAPDIGDLYSEVAQYVKGSRTDIETEHIVATTPPSLQSQFITTAENDAFLNRFSSQNGNIRLLSIGTYNESDVGHTCYHGKLNTLELIYHHLLDGQNDIVVADATAGIDNLGTSLYFAYDTNIFVVEPTRKSIDVFLEFEKVSRSHNLRTKVIINKVEDGDEAFVAQYIEDDKILGVISRSNSIRRLEQGDPDALSEFVEENSTVLQNTLKYVQFGEKKWNAYYQSLLEIHRKNSLEWWNDYYKSAIDKQMDPEFNYHKVI